MRVNAEIITATAAEMRYAAVSTPNGYWHQSPGKLAYYCLPGDYRFEQAAILRQTAPASLMLVSTSGGVLSADFPSSSAIN
jgi:hypothetical protein